MARASGARSSRRWRTVSTCAVAKGDGSFFCPNENDSKPRDVDRGVVRAVDNPGQQRPPGRRLGGFEDPAAWVRSEEAGPHPGASRFDQQSR